MPKQMKLCVYMMGGNSSYRMGGWRDPGSYADIGSNFARWVDIAQKLERAKFDMMFIADIIGPMSFAQPEVFARSPYGDRFDPVTLLGGLAAATRRLGLAATIATAYTKPYDVARRIASLDLMSGGRAAWNIVTGQIPEDAALFGMPYEASVDRYAQGEEFVDIVTALWSSVDANAYPRDKATGIYADVAKVHAVEYEGKHYTVHGAFSVTPSAQGRPVLIQAGQSEDGRALAARVAEVVFTVQPSFDLAKAYYNDLKTRAVAFGRSPDHIKILPGVVPIVGETRAEADAKEAFLDELIDPSFAASSLMKLLKSAGLPDTALDGPIPELPSTAGGRAHNFVALARMENLTLRQVLTRVSATNAHWTVKGTAVEVVDRLEHWFRNAACDGFNLLCPTMPPALDDFIELILPELRRRGLFRTEYEGATLRENLGVPANLIPSRRAQQ
jgi:FMN-dependent oxidoreductase (nitrilotriacetate monooxygenase family)